MSYLEIHTRPLYKQGVVGRPRVRKRRTTWYKKNLKNKDWSLHKSTVKDNRPEDIKLWKETMVKYKEAFNDMCISALNGYYLNDEFISKSWAGKLVFQSIISLWDNDKLPRKINWADIELCDVENRLMFIWYKIISRYNQRKPVIPFDNYLFRMSLFSLKWWLKSVKAVKLPYWEDQTTFSEEQDFILDLKTLIFGAEKPPYSHLNPYERIVLFMKYVEDLSDTDISKRLGCNRDKVRRQLNKTIVKLQRFYSFTNGSS